MSYITNLPSSGWWLDTTEGWYLHGTSDFLVQETLQGDGFDHVDNGPYSLNVQLSKEDNPDVSSYVDMGRTFICDGDLSYHFDFCHMELEGGVDYFRLFGSLYTEDKPFPPSDHESWSDEMNLQYDAGDSIADLGETLPEEDQLNVWKNEHHGKSYDYSWKCKYVEDVMESSADHIGYHIAMRMDTDWDNDVFTIRDFEAVCSRNTVDYNIFALSDPSDSIVFGFRTGPDNTPKASKATVLIDFYGDKGSDILRCRHFGVKPSTSYACYSRGDNVFPISSHYNTNDFEHKLIIRAFEHGGMDVSAAFVGSAESLALAVVRLDMESQHFSSNTLWLRFALTTADTATTIVFQDSAVDVYSVNDIDAEYGTIKTESVDGISVQFEWNYDPNAGDCVWDEDVDESINAIQSGGPWGAVGTVGSIAVVLGDVAQGAGALPVFGNAAMAIANIANLFGGGPSTEELTQDALQSLKAGTDEMIKCNQQIAADKMNALKENVDTALKELQVQIEEDLKEWSIELIYKIHIENVEQEIAGIQDTMTVLLRQWEYIDDMTDNHEILEELKNILMNTMPRLGTMIKKKPSDADFDYFWRLYSKEMSLYLEQILTVRFDIWALWLSYNGIPNEPDKSIQDIEPDFRRVFRDLTSELIGEYMHLLPMAILTIMKPEFGSDELEQMKMQDRFQDIELRLKPSLICGWMAMAQSLTEMDDGDSLGDYGDLYDDNLDECASNVRIHIINEVVRVDNSRHHDNEMIFGKELEYSSVLYQYKFVKDPYGCSLSWPESDDCRMSMPLRTNVNEDEYDITVEGPLKLQIVPLLLINETEYVAPAVVEIEGDLDNPRADSRTSPTIYTNSDGFPGTFMSISCPDNYRMSGIRFGNVSYGGTDDEDNVSDANEDNSEAEVPTTTRDPYWPYIKIDHDHYEYGDINLNKQSTDPSRTFDTYKTIAVKLLCRPIPAEKQDLYDTFTDYEIVTAVPDDNVKEKEVSWDAWTVCPIGTFVDRIGLRLYQTTDTVHLGYTMTWESSIYDYTQFWDTVYEERPISWYSEFKIYCYDGDQQHTYSSLLNDVDIASSFDINYFKSDHFWTLISLLMVLGSLQLLFCFYQRKKTTKRIEHFNQETSDDENVV